MRSSLKTVCLVIITAGVAAHLANRPPAAPPDHRAACLAAWTEHKWAIDLWRHDRGAEDFGVSQISGENIAPFLVLAADGTCVYEFSADVIHLDRNPDARFGWMVSEGEMGRL